LEKEIFNMFQDIDRDLETGMKKKKKKKDDSWETEEDDDWEDI